MSLRVFIGVFASSAITFQVMGNTAIPHPIFDGTNVSAFIQQAYTPTYDCPSSSLNSEVEKALVSGVPNQQQILQLTSMKTHGLICAGDASKAQAILQRLLANDLSDRSAKYYASAIFQYGFIYDLQEKPERCDYFRLARDSSTGKHDDVHLSASLGYITECERDDVNSQVFGLYQLLETVANMNNPAALAHAFNRVGYFYALKGQHGLAAAQYSKAVEIGQDIYTDENLMAILGSLVAALQSINDAVKTREALDKFIQLNERSGTKRTLFLQYLFEAAYFVSVKDYDALAVTLNNWKKIASDSDSSVNQGLLRWYESELCYYQQDIPCLLEFLENEKNAPATYVKYINKSKSYIRFKVLANIMVGNKQESIEAFDKYLEIMNLVIRNTQDNYSAVDMSSLHTKIINLDDSRKAQEQRKIKMLVALFVAVVIVLLAVFLFFWRKYIDSKSYDSVTGVLTNNAILKKLGALSKPSANCTNALAIFDIANFTEVNLTLGSTKSDFVLEQIANTLKKITRHSDLLGRFGPEQFILCLVDIEEDAAQAFFERAKDALTNTFSEHNLHHAISVDSSMSIYYSTDTFDDLPDILSNMLLSMSMKADHA